MYSINDRQQLLHQILAFIQENREFECLLQIGSGADGFTDIYSDIDCMAGCVDAAAVMSANKKLEAFSVKSALFIWTAENGVSMFSVSPPIGKMD